MQARGEASETGGHAGLFVELAAPPAGASEEFESWYQQERIPWRCSQPGVLGGGRYQELGYDTGWATFYDLAETASARLDVVAELSESQQLMTARLPRFEERIYESIPVPDFAATGRAREGKLLMAVWWTPRDGMEQDFHDWYNEEHIGMLMKVPGWLEIRRYRRIAFCPTHSR